MTARSTRRPASNPLDWLASASRVRSPWGRGVAYLLLVYAILLWLVATALKPVGMVLLKLGRWVLPRLKPALIAVLVRVQKLKLPGIGAEEINMTGPQSGSYDKDGLPW